MEQGQGPQAMEDSSLSGVGGRLSLQRYLDRVLEKGRKLIVRMSQELSKCIVEMAKAGGEDTTAQTCVTDTGNLNAARKPKREQDKYWTWAKGEP